MIPRLIILMVLVIGSISSRAQDVISASVTGEKRAVALQILIALTIDKATDEYIERLSGDAFLGLQQINPGISSDIVHTAVTELIEPAWRQNLPHLRYQAADKFAAAYSAEELEGLYAFFGSPLGRKYTATRPLIEDDLQKISSDWSGRVAKVVMSEQVTDFARRGLKLPPP